MKTIIKATRSLCGTYSDVVGVRSDIKESITSEISVLDEVIRDVDQPTNNTDTVPNELMSPWFRSYTFPGISLRHGVSVKKRLKSKRKMIKNSRRTNRKRG